MGKAPHLCGTPPHVYSLDLIVRNQQTKLRSRDIQQNALDQHTEGVKVMRHKKRQRTCHTEVDVTGEDLTTKARWGPGLGADQKKNLDKGHSLVNTVVSVLIYLHLMIILWM